MYDCLATCPQELRDVLSEELAQLGASSIRNDFRCVRFQASKELFLKLHLYLSTASHLYLILHEGKAWSLAEITKAARKLPWAEFCSPHGTFKVDGIVGEKGPNCPTSNELSRAIRLGIEERLPKAKVELESPTITATVFWRKGFVSISIQSSGKTLHKRGYQDSRHPATLKETLAAALVKLAGYDGTQCLWDPMCGSGTILIEAAFLALHKAPLIHRKKGEFSMEHWANFPKDTWRALQDAARLEKETELKAPIIGGDISEIYISIAQGNALRARVEKYIQWYTKSFFETPAPQEKGIIISNLPYGHRLKDGNEEFFSQLGFHLKHHCTSWKAVFIVSKDSPWQKIGLKPSKKIPVLNGSIESLILFYDLFKGKRKDQKNEETC